MKLKLIKISALIAFLVALAVSYPVVQKRYFGPFYEPDMQAIPAGAFTMGCTASRTCHSDRRDKPVHPVSVPEFKMAATEVTVKEYLACVNSGVCNGLAYTDGADDLPVVNVSWLDAQVYIQWLNGRTAKSYRLPSEAEWEYAARAGTETNFSWGDDHNCSNAHLYSDECGKTDDPKVVGSYSANDWGLFDMHGNAYEWVEDCMNYSYAGAPEDGSAWLAVSEHEKHLEPSCDKRVLRSGSIVGWPFTIASWSRGVGLIDSRHQEVGFRLAHD